MPQNFTFADVAGTLLALAVSPLFFLIPGYVLGWALDLVRFRKRAPRVQFALSLPLSISLTPAVLYLLGNQLNVTAVWVFFALTWIAFAVIALRTGLRLPRIDGRVRTVALLWSSIVLLSLVDLQWGNKLYYSVVAFDYSVRSAVVSALARTVSYPPANPFFFAGHAAPFRYHYFYFLLCSLADRLFCGIISPRHALFAAVIVVGLALICTVFLYLQFFYNEGGIGFCRRMIIALALLSISGLDILFTGPKLLGRLFLHRGTVYPSVDWWNADQVAGWLDTALWVPHHMAGLIACLTGFLILWDARESQTQWRSALGAALAFAAATGLSIYVAFVFGVFLIVWAGALLWRRKYRELAGFAIAGVLAGVLASPFLLDLVYAGTAGMSGEESSSFIRFSVRLFTPTAVMLQSFGLDQPGTLLVTNLLMLPVNYFVEFGLFFGAAAIQIREWVKREAPFTEADAAAVTMAGVSIIVCSLFRSNTISNNDLGMRGILIAQFCLLLWAVDVLSLMNWRKPGLLLALTFLCGAATNVYELISLRAFTLLADSGFDPGPNLFVAPNTNFGRQVFDYRQAYEWLDHNTLPNTVEQQFPLGLGDFSPGLYSNRQFGLLDAGTAISFGADPEEVRAMAKALEMGSACTGLSVDAIVVRSSNELFRDRASWVWQRPALFSNQNTRVYGCSDRGGR